MRLPSAARLPHRPEEAQPQVQGQEIPDDGVPGTSENAKKLGLGVPATTTNAEVSRLMIRKSDLQLNKIHLDKNFTYVNLANAEI